MEFFFVKHFVAVKSRLVVISSILHPLPASSPSLTSTPRTYQTLICQTLIETSSHPQRATSVPACLLPLGTSKEKCLLCAEKHSSLLMFVLTLVCSLCTKRCYILGREQHLYCPPCQHLPCPTKKKRGCTRHTPSICLNFTTKKHISKLDCFIIAITLAYAWHRLTLTRRAFML